MIERLKSAINIYGFINGLIYITNQLFKRIFKDNVKIDKFYLYAQPISKKSLLPESRLAKYNLFELKKEFVDISKFGRPKHIINQRYSQGGRCIACFKDEVLLGYIWFTLKPYKEDVVCCTYVPKPSKQVAWDYDIYVEPKHRLGFTFMALWDALNKELSRSGYEWSMSRISAFAIESIRSHSRLKAVRLSTLLFFTFFKMQILFATTKPFFHISFNKKNCPTVIVNKP